MIIVSQDKKRISQNLEVGIYPEYNGEFPEPKILYYKIENDRVILGEYQTEERAKEVLQEIVKTYVLTEQYKVEDERTQIKLIMEGILLYEMPED